MICNNFYPSLFTLVPGIKLHFSMVSIFTHWVLSPTQGLIFMKTCERLNEQNNLHASQTFSFFKISMFVFKLDYTVTIFLMEFPYICMYIFIIFLNNFFSLFLYTIFLTFSSLLHPFASVVYLLFSSFVCSSIIFSFIFLISPGPF